MNRIQLEELVSGIVDQCQAELESIDVVPAGKRRIVRVTVDGDGASGKGLSIDEVGDISREISRALDDGDAMGEQPYTLEVSTRGVTKPLTKPAHYRRIIGRLVMITDHDSARLTGRITQADDHQVTIVIDDDAQRQVTYDQIAKAVIQIEMNRPLGEEN